MTTQLRLSLQEKVKYLEPYLKSLGLQTWLNPGGQVMLLCWIYSKEGFFELVAKTASGNSRLL